MYAEIDYKGSKVGENSFDVTGSGEINVSEFTGEVTGSGEEGFELHFVVDGAVRPTSEKPYVITLPAAMKVNTYGVSEVTATCTGTLANVSEFTTGDVEVTVQIDTVSVNPELPDGDYNVEVNGSYSAAWTSDNGRAVTGMILDTEVNEEIGNNTPVSGTFGAYGNLTVESGTPTMDSAKTTLYVRVEGDTISTSNGAVSDVTVGDVTYKADTDTYTR